MSYLLDTDWLIRALARREPAFTALKWASTQSAAVSWISVAELYEGPLSSPFPEYRLLALRHFLASFRVIGIDDAVALRFAEIRSDLRRRGELISDLDILIAATALVYDLTLITLNRRHFERIQDLRIFSDES